LGELVDGRSSAIAIAITRQRRAVLHTMNRASPQSMLVAM